MRLPPLAAIAALLMPSATAGVVNFESPHVHPIDLSPDGSTLAVCNTLDNRVELFDLTSGTPSPLGSVAVGIDPVSARFESDTSLWVVNQISDSVSVVDVPNLVVRHTLATEDEPADVVFARSPPLAFVSCSQTNSVMTFFPDDLSRAPGAIGIYGEEPRALATDPDGRLHIAFFESGNETTILAGGGDGDIINFPPNAVSDPRGPHGGVNPPPNDGAGFSPPERPGNPSPPPVGLIVRQDASGVWEDDTGADWTPFVSGNLAPASGRVQGWGLNDIDVAIAQISAGRVTGSVRRLMNLCMAIAVNPVSGRVAVVGTDATNEVRFEPNVNGTFLRVLFASYDPADTTGTTVTDLNPHLDYSTPTAPQVERDLSIGDPRGIAWKPDGTRAYVTGMGSNNVVVIDQNGARAGLAPTIEVGEGPTGIVADAARGQLYVLNRFGASVSVIDLGTELETARVAFFDPTPDEIKIGRRFLYDTHLTSGLGHVSCASCHVDSRTDRLAWDLGDPGGEMIEVGAPRHNLGGNFPGLNSNFTDFHPMKGPMTTQTLQDIIGKEPHHWRGDRDGIEDFNGAFVSLLGDDQLLTATEMQQFEDYLATITIPPNPYRGLDNSLPTDVSLEGQVTGARFGPAGQPMPNGNALRAFNTMYRPLSRGIDRGALACITCHTIPTGLGTDSTFTFSGFLPLEPGGKGERHHALVSVDGSSQRAIKVPQTRLTYDKLGFDMTSAQSLSGFGILHDGSVDGLSRFLSEDAFEPENNQQVADLVALMLAFSGSDFPGTPEGFEPPGTASQDAHAAVGQQQTVTSAAADARLDAFMALAEAGEVELVAHSTVSGIPRGWSFVGPDQFAADQAGLVESKATLLARASAANPVTFTCVPAGCGHRLGVDRDGDGLFDYDESRDFAPGVTGFQNPFQSNATDSTGDNGSTAPDGVPDGENDFDGDGVDNADEIAAGSNPADNLSVEVPFAETVNGDATSITISWDAAPLGEYQVMVSDALGLWREADGGHFVATVAGGRMDWSQDITRLRAFYRIVRLR